MTAPRLLVDIVTDFVCPWCYVGLRAFKAARADLEGAYQVLPRFRAYQLNPGAPEEGVDREAHYAEKFPSASFRAAMRARLIEAAAEADFAFDPGRPKRVPNTVMAHQVLRWAHFDGLQEAVAFKLYEGFWAEDCDLGDAKTLSRLAGEAGMDEAEIAQKLETRVDREAVEIEAAMMRAAGVTGVPTFIVNERAGFSGALPPRGLAAALRKAADAGAKAAR
ncbi:DsbA family oxidoreductase [Amphiplicatus metriothermophilus]|uniref:Predicted dithiol-disulfide isomerase, DsbA family n=1 Tax=Amphiplicatus metriothermophilus TaxID=1519374 RepID=A0A239PJW9_9PROT|nr:DsbA family oxidoreductase [Amphiplicatus metriothermophilus]MBB5517826.1 putative DsbA family dithiol-disulfide isomerase [Amphiplicatus metriothermophilus]SNT67840.1 Predicted dithiol-disulfide isomerase, DsbA family [Amphiplicatus metriothermophilus]